MYIGRRVFYFVHEFTVGVKMWKIEIEAVLKKTDSIQVRYYRCCYIRFLGI